MAHARTRFVCQACGAIALRWEGRCSQCGAWHSIVEEPLSRPQRRSRRASAPPTPTLAELEDPCGEQRLTTGIAEFDRVLGGGIVRDSVVLLAGDPGIGKSTLLLQAAAGVAAQGGPVLYVTGEESPAQVKERARRLGIDGERIHLLGRSEVEAVEASAEKLKPALLIVDSAQTLRAETCAGSPGTVGQVRESVARLAQHAKEHSYALFIVSHVTKEGLVAGPKVVEHIVDVVLRLEGETPHDFRVLRAGKNRFGPAGEVGVFHMDARGLHGLESYDSFLRPTQGPAGPGAATVVVCEGTRPLVVEVQALVTPTQYQIPNRRVTGLDPNRISLHLALLGKNGIDLSHRDVFVNVAGGLRITEPGADLGVILAVASSFFEIPLPSNVAAAAEVGLRSELRGLHRFELRCREAFHHGIRRIVAARANERARIPPGLSVDWFSELPEVLAHFFGPVAGGEASR